MFEDLLLILISIVGAVGAFSAHNMQLNFLAALCVLIYTAAIFCMGYRSKP